MQTESVTSTPYKIGRGHPQPFGATPYAEGVNFSLISAYAEAVSLVLFSPSDLTKPLCEIALNPLRNKTGTAWHIFIYGLPLETLYLYKIDKAENLLLDPYARETFSTNRWLENEKGYRPYGGIPHKDFDWQNDTPPLIPVKELVIYEMHVRGFTQHGSSQVKHPGTFLGMIEKIPYLKELGVNALEFLPIFEFNEAEYTKINPRTKKRLCNYWGYSTVNFFSPMQRYASSNDPEAAIVEFKTLVKELHKNGIEVILDVVYNHTFEGGNPGITLSYKGLDEKVYYILDEKGHYLNFSGCGNTLNCNHPIVRELIENSLRYWVTEMHVDGFRFDLASILTRGTKGQPLIYSPLIEKISRDPLLSQVKLIAEPWDAGGLYQVGTFYLHGYSRWSEWNGRYRDRVRAFIKGTGNKKHFSTDICGSQDLYYHEFPCNSVNFVCAHDGFTLTDLVSYNRKHNQDNGENNLDGTNNNESWNCGIEGHTQSKQVMELRTRQMKNLLLALMVSRGIPMVHMGDEYGHTKNGNNNTWCQDNELNWFLWDQQEKQAEFFRFYRLMIQFRKKHPLLYQNQFLKEEQIQWHGIKPFTPNWEMNNHFVAFTLLDSVDGNDLYIAFNAAGQPVEVEIPTPRKGFLWHLAIYTAYKSPKDFIENLEETKLDQEIVLMPSHSALLLKSIENKQLQKNS